MQIKEVSEKTGLTKKAIEYYKEKDIVSPKILDNGYRDFSEEDIYILKRVSAFRSLGLSISDIKDILESKFPKEELRKCVLKKNLENDLSSKQTDLLDEISKGRDIESISKEIESLNNSKSIKENILEMFPGFYGRFLISHFRRFLKDPIKTEKQKKAYKKIIGFLDRVEPLNISDEIMDEFEEAMDFWNDEKLENFEKEKQNNIENSEEFLKEQAQMIEDYQAFKESEEYKNSSFSKISLAIKAFGESSGYNDIFIPAMRNLSPSYEEYYQNLLKANERFIEKYPGYK